MRFCSQCEYRLYPLVSGKCPMIEFMYGQSPNLQPRPHNITLGKCEKHLEWVPLERSHWETGTPWYDARKDFVRIVNKDD